MMNFLQRKINLIVVFTIALTALIPIIKTYGGLNIGHDTLVPIIPENSFKMAYEWLDSNNGSYTSNNYIIWISIFYFFTSFGLTIYQSAFIYQFLIYFLSATAIFKIFNLFNKGNRLFGLLPAVFFILSPHHLDHMIYYQGTVGITWTIYFILKFIKNKKLTYLDIVLTSLSIGLITDLPNPKYHFLLFLVGFISLILALFIKILSLKDIIKSAKNFLLLAICTLYLSGPFLFYGYSFLKGPTRINVKENYQEFGDTLDYKYAVVSKMVRLFHSPNLNAKDGELISTPFYFLMYYAIPIIVLGIFPFIMRSLDYYSKRIYLIFYLLALFLLFLAKSSNPPFGLIYDTLLTNIQAFAFMRTTAGIIIYAAIFYVLIYGRIFQYIVESVRLKKKTKKLFVFILALIILTTGFPIWSGHYFLNRSTVNPYIDRSKHGQIIPKDYFAAAEFLKKFKLDTKIDVYSYTAGYQDNSWGYFGFELYPWIIYQPSVSFKKLTSQGKVLSNTNTRYILHDKTLGANYPVELFWHTPETQLFSSKKIDIYQKSLADFLTHFYTANAIVNSSVITDELFKRIPKERLVAISENKMNSSILSLSISLLDHPQIEYRKINPTKYRVRIHKTSKPFLLVFTENFHPLWKLYLSDEIILDEEMQNLMLKSNNYNLFEYNEKDQATREQLVEFIQNGWITTLGSSEKNYVDFISKNFKGTIQNDNLAKNIFTETLFKKSLDTSHFSVNGYANGWYLNPFDICSKNRAGNLCKRNGDGSYDFELIVEFWPQKLSYLGYLTSATTMLFLLLFSGFNTLLSRYRPKASSF